MVQMCRRMKTCMGISRLKLIFKLMEADVVDPDSWMMSSRRGGGVSRTRHAKATRRRWRGHVIDASEALSASFSPSSAFVLSSLPVYVLQNNMPRKAPPLDEGTDIPSLVGLAVSHRSGFWTASLLIVLSTARLRQQAKHIAKRVPSYT
jgi:hypothetical protein